MARLLYGLCGEGLGHASRSRILINHLKKNHDIKIIAGGKAYTFLSKEFDDVTKIESARFVYKNNQVSLIQSCLRMGYKTITGSIPSFFTVRQIIKEFKPDILVTDADPIGHYAARFTRGLKRISIDNPQVLLHRKYKVFWDELFPWFTLIVATKMGMYGADKYIIYDFSDEQIDDDRVLFLKPLIQEGILQQEPRYGNHIFVYQTVGGNDYLLEMLKKLDETFVIYGFNKDLVDKNITFKRFNEGEFYNDIAYAKAVITNGGFTVISEALYLKKPVLSLPIKNQFEQILNGKFVEKLGVGEYHMSIDEERLRGFFKHLDKYKKQLKSYDPSNQKKTLERVEQEILALIPDSSKS